MSHEHHDDDCPGCKPVLLDARTGKPLPDDSPEMRAINQVWAGTTIEERRAFHRVTVNNSRDENDLTIVQALSWRIQAAMRMG